MLDQQEASFASWWIKPTIGGYVTDTIITRRELAFEATVPRTLVHRAAAHEVFLTDSLVLDDRELQVGAHLPRYHGLYDDKLTAPSGPDLMLLMETSRQAAVLVAHRHLGVPLGHHFVLLESDIQRPTDGVGFVADSNAVLKVDVLRQKERNGVVSEYEVKIATVVGDLALCVARLRISCWAGEAYSRLRGSRDVTSIKPLPPGPAAEPWLVGRRRPDNVAVNVLEAESGTYSVRVDTGHPCFFDHQLDHVPGMLQLEAARQAAVHLCASRFVRSPGHAHLAGCDASFSRFAELDAPLIATAEVLQDELTGMVVDISITQNGEPCAHIKNRLAFLSDAQSPMPAV